MHVITLSIKSEKECKGSDISQRIFDALNNSDNFTSNHRAVNIRAKKLKGKTQEVVGRSNETICYI